MTIQTAYALRRSAAAACFALVLLAQPGSRASVADALPFSKSYLVTGNYAVGSVDLAPQSAAQGFVTGTIPMGGVPADADVLAAFLYWETISTADPQVNGATFRGLPLVAVKTSSAVLDPTLARCWPWDTSSSAPHTMTMFRADVLRLLPDRTDANG